MKKTMLASLLALSALTSVNASAGDACKTILCLGGIIAGGDGGSECSGAIADYFDIKKYRKGDFSPSRTLKARTSYLNQCAADDGGYRDKINDKWGKAFSM